MRWINSFPSFCSYIYLVSVTTEQVHSWSGRNVNKSSKIILEGNLLRLVWLWKLIRGTSVDKHPNCFSTCILSCDKILFVLQQTPVSFSLEAKVLSEFTHFHMLHWFSIAASGTVTGILILINSTPVANISLCEIFVQMTGWYLYIVKIWHCWKSMKGTESSPGHRAALNF